MATEQFKILLVEDNAIDARVIEGTLAKAGLGKYFVTRVERLCEALDQLRDQKFDLVLLDFTLPDSEGVSTFMKLREKAPDIAVVALTSLSDEDIATQVVRLGAQDFLVKGQVQPAGMLRAIRYAIERHKVQTAKINLVQAPKTGKIIGVVGARGGVGTTTAVVNIATVLARKQKNVIAAEFPTFYGAFYDLFFYKMGKIQVSSLSSLLALDREKITSRELESRMVKLQSGVNLLLGPEKPEEFLELNPDKIDALMHLFQESNRFVILDLPASASAAYQVIAKHCDFIVVVIERTPMCVMAGKAMVELLRYWGVMAGMVGAMVVNRQPLSTAMEMPEILSTMGCDLIGVIPPAAEGCMRAQRTGTPLVMCEPESSASTALSDVAERLAAEHIVTLRF